MDFSFNLLFLISGVLLALIIGFRNEILAIFRLKKNITDEYQEVEVTSEEQENKTLPKGFKSTQRIKKIRISTIHKILLTLGIVKIKKQDG